MRSVTPFDTLAAPELETLVSRMEIAFFPSGQHIVNKGDPPFQYLHVIQQGSAGIYLTDDRGEKMLVDVRGEGDYFGGTSLLQETPAMFEIIAQQDLITLILPAAELQQLVKKYPVFQRYFGASLARTIQAVRESSAYCQPRLIVESAVNLDVFMTGKRVADLMSKNVLTCAPGVSVQTAARRMAQRRVSSIVVSGNRLHPLGIVTDNDLRTKVLAAGLNPEVSVTAIMSRPVQTIAADAYSFDALLTM
ncbi:MAG: cyclic nucleotide-binding domain-containing protein, partial [Desulfobacterales bacterium]